MIARKHHHHARTVRMLACTAGAALAAAGLAAASPASATVLGISCLGGTNSIEYSPGVTLTPAVQDVDVTSAHSSCTSLTQPDIAYGTSSAHLTTEVSCVDPLSFDPAPTKSITWREAGGAYAGASTISITSTTTSTVTAGKLITRTGTVTSGLFAGQPYVETVVYAAIDPLIDCLGEGITRQDSLLHATGIGI